MPAPPLTPAAATGLEDVALVFGALLVAGALSAGIMRRTLLSMVPVYVLAGYLLYAFPEQFTTGPNAVVAIEKITGRQLGAAGREIVAVTVEEGLVRKP